MSDGLPEIQSALVKQADDIIDEETTAVDLVAELDVNRYRHKDSRGSRGDANRFEPMFKAVLLRELEDWSDPELRRKLDNPEIAEPLGFILGDVPCRSTFYRARKNRFEDAERVIERSVQQIHELAWERGSPIGTSLKPKEGSGTSQRSKDREIRKRTFEVLKEMENVVFPELNLPQSDEAIYEEDDLLMVEALACALNEVGLNEAANIYGDKLDPRGELDSEDPFYEDGPSGETVIEPLKQLLPTAISEMVNRAARKTFTRVRPYEEFPARIHIAVDITYVAYYGDRDEMVRVQGVPQNRDKSYDWCHKFATANIVGETTHFTVAMLPVADPNHHDSDAYPGKDKTYRSGAVVRDLLEIVQDIIPVHVMYADREFYSAETIAACEDNDVRYVIPVPASADRDVSATDGKVTVKQEHVLHGPVKHRVTNTRVETTIAVLPPDEQNGNDQPFATNLEVNDEIGLDRRRTRKKIERYRWRGGIETAYSKIKEFGGMTTSRSFSVRLFHFGMGVLLYDMWLLVDFLVQVSMGVEVQSKPRVTAEAFRERIKNLLEEFLPG